MARANARPMMNSATSGSGPAYRSAHADYPVITPWG